LKVVLWAYDLSTDGPWQSSESAALAVKSRGVVSWRDGRLCGAANEAIKAIELYYDVYHSRKTTM
jgi:hypothetical protein